MKDNVIVGNFGNRPFEFEGITIEPYTEMTLEDFSFEGTMGSCFEKEFFDGALDFLKDGFYTARKDDMENQFIVKGIDVMFLRISDVVESTTFPGHMIWKPRINQQKDNPLYIWAKIKNNEIANGEEWEDEE